MERAQKHLQQKMSCFEVLSLGRFRGCPEVIRHETVGRTRSTAGTGASFIPWALPGPGTMDLVCELWAARMEGVVSVTEVGV